jgi:hypothetical protein
MGVQVMLAREKATKEIFAIKILKKDVILAKVCDVAGAYENIRVYSVLLSV